MECLYSLFTHLRCFQTVSKKKRGGKSNSEDENTPSTTRKVVADFHSDACKRARKHNCVSLIDYKQILFSINNVFLILKNVEFLWNATVVFFKLIFLI